MNRPASTDDPVALAWHDVTCPEAAGCRSRALHALDTSLAGAVLPRFLDRLAELRRDTQPATLPAQLAQLTGYAPTSRTVQAFEEVARAYAAQQLREAADWLWDETGAGTYAHNHLKDRADALEAGQ